MRLFLAIPNSKSFVKLLEECDAQNVLFSFAFFNDIKAIKNCFGNWKPKNILVDSGAFSVWSRNETIDINKYAEFCYSVIDYFPDSDIHCVNLDVLPGNFGRMPTDKERKESVLQGRENYFYLSEKKGLSTVPVFHQHEDFAGLKQMMKDVKNKNNYIGLSPANDQSAKSKNAWLSKAFSITTDKVKTHGFGVTAFQQLVQFPFFSCDSSSWTSGGRFARVPIIENGQIKGVNFKDKDTLSRMWKGSSIKDPSLLTNYHARNKQGALAFIEMETFLNKIWTQRGINWEK